MKKILSLAVLLMTALVGFTACNNDDENDDVKSLAKTSFATTLHVSDEIKTGDLVYTVSFNDDSQCVMRVESRDMKLLGIDATYSDVTFYGGTYTMNAGTITFNVDCITTEEIATPYSIIDSPQTRTFTYNPDTKVLTTEDGVELNSTKFTHLECKKYAASNDIDDDVYTLDDLVGTWGVSYARCSDKFVDLYVTVKADGTASLVMNTCDLTGRNRKAYRASGPIDIRYAGGHTIIFDDWDWSVHFDSYSDGVLKGIVVEHYPTGMVIEVPALSKQK